jgi:hypothetical protein
MRFSLKLNIPGVLALSLLATTPAKGAAAGREVVIEQVPASVKATLDRELPGANLNRGLLTGKKNTDQVYDLNVKQLDTEWNIQITDAGDLIAKRRRQFEGGEK